MQVQNKYYYRLPIFTSIQTDTSKKIVSNTQEELCRKL